MGDHGGKRQGAGRKPSEKIQSVEKIGWTPEVKKWIDEQPNKSAAINAAVYVIKNIINNKVYVGSSKDWKKRIQWHIKQLKKGNHPNYKLQRAWGKYGESAFCVEVLEAFVETEGETIFDIEQKWIDFYESFRKGYNLSPLAVGGAREGAGRPSTGRTEEERFYLSPEAKAKLAAIAKLLKVPKGQVIEDLLNQHEVTMENQDIQTIGKLVNEIVDANEALTIYTMPNLSAKMQLACEYFNLTRKDLDRFEGKTPAYFKLVACFNRLQNSIPLPLVDLLDELDDLIRAIRELKEFCGILDESIEPQMPQPLPSIRDTFYKEYVERKKKG